MTTKTQDPVRALRAELRDMKLILKDVNAALRQAQDDKRDVEAKLARAERIATDNLLDAQKVRHIDALVAHCAHLFAPDAAEREAALDDVRAWLRNVGMEIDKL